MNIQILHYNNKIFQRSFCGFENYIEYYPRTKIMSLIPQENIRCYHSKLYKQISLFYCRYDNLLNFQLKFLKETNL